MRSAGEPVRGRAAAKTNTCFGMQRTTETHIFNFGRRVDKVSKVIKINMVNNSLGMDEVGSGTHTRTVKCCWTPRANQIKKALKGKADLVYLVFTQNWIKTEQSNPRETIYRLLDSDVHKTVKQNKAHAVYNR